MDLSALMLFDPTTGKTEMVESDPLKRVDFGQAVFSEATDELVLTTYDDDKVRRYFKDKSFEADYKWLAEKLPGKEINRTSSTFDEKTWLVSASSDTEPGETYLFDRKTHKLTRKAAARISGTHDACPLQVIGRVGNSSVPHASQRHFREEPAHNYLSAWRPVGT
jgi:dipeptidyl aminopeptidase/acylaminoacyl peptidase